MPIYEYACTACDHRADILHAINDPGPKFCPSCGSEGTMRKVIAAPTIHYRGSGWAKKDRSATARSKRSDGKADGDGGEKTADKGEKAGPATSDDGTKTDKPAAGGSGSAATDD